MVLTRTALGLDGIWWSISVTCALRGLVSLIMICLFFRWQKKNPEKAAPALRSS